MGAPALPRSALLLARPHKRELTLWLWDVLGLVHGTVHHGHGCIEGLQDLLSLQELWQTWKAEIEWLTWTLCVMSDHDLLMAVSSPCSVVVSACSAIASDAPSHFRC